MALKPARIGIRNFGCFTEVELRPAGVDLLLGRNGVGKSTLFDILFGLRGLLGQGSDGDAGFPAFQPEIGTASVEVELVGGRRRLRYLLELAPPPAQTELSLGSDWVIAREELWDGSELVARFDEGVFTARDLVSNVRMVRGASPLAVFEAPTNHAISRLKRWVDDIWLLHLEPSRMVGEAAEDDDHEGLDVSGENFVPWLLGTLRDSPRPRLAEITASVRSAVDGLRRLRFERAGRARVLVADFSDGRRVDFADLSDGQRALIALHAVLLLTRDDRSLLLLDEPDAHVTSEEIRPLLTLLRAQQEATGTPILIASHHPLLIDLLAPDAPIELVRRGKGVVARPFRVDLGVGVSASQYLLLRDSR